MVAVNFPHFCFLRISSQHETHVRALEVEIEDQLRHVDSQVRQEVSQLSA